MQDSKASATRPGRCPCDTGLDHDSCCGRLLRGASGKSAVEVMRSRFSAYVLHDADHLLRTWHPETAPRALRFDGGQRWISLEITDVVRGSVFDDVGVVAFVATFQADGERRCLRERSRFRRTDSGWVYVDAESSEVTTG